LINGFRVIELEVVGKGKYFPSGDRKVFMVGGYLVGEIERPVRSMNLLANLEDETHDTLVQSMNTKTRTIRSRLTLISLGAISQELLILKSGRTVEVLKRPDESFQRLSFLTEGSIVGLESFLGGEPSPVTINTTEDCVLLRITRRNCESLLSLNPEFEVALIREMARVESYRARSLLFEFQNMRMLADE
jgi:CRP-like cAMP-binding protein